MANEQKADGMGGRAQYPRRGLRCCPRTRPGTTL